MRVPPTHRPATPPSLILPWVWAGLALPLAAAEDPGPSRAPSASLATPGTYDVRAFGAAGDGKTLDTRAIQAAIDACSDAGGGKVVLTAGTYLSGSIHLRSRITFALDAAARLVGASDTEAYTHYKGPEFAPESRWTRWQRALILAVGVEDVAIVGPGTIDGNKVFDPKGEEKMRGPHTITIGDSRRVVVRDLDIRDSANYAVLVQHSSDIEVRDVQITGGWDGVHFRGWIDRPCRDIRIVGCRLYTGDDAIAGRYAERLLISGCILNSSCNGLRIIGPVEHAIVDDCLFYGPGLYPHRTQSRHNMLSGILLQPGAWDASDGKLDDVLISNTTMKDVQSPLSISMHRPGSRIGNVTVQRLDAVGVYRSAMSVESWNDHAIERVVLRDVNIEYLGAGPPPAEKGEAAERAKGLETTKPSEASGDRKPMVVPPPGLDARALPIWGFYARNVKELVLEDVRLSRVGTDARPALLAERVGLLRVDGLRLPAAKSGEEDVILREVERIEGKIGEETPGREE